TMYHNDATRMPNPVSNGEGPYGFGSRTATIPFGKPTTIVNPSSGDNAALVDT
ncbi:MAG: hypothetical protein ACD_36C00127G0001, partial [uncultured bacterium]